MLDVRRSGVESVIPLVIEGHGLEGAGRLLDVGAGSNFIIFEEDGAAGISLRVYSMMDGTSALQK